MVDTSKGEAAHAGISVFLSLCLGPQGMPHTAVKSWRVSLVLDLLLLSIRHHKIPQSAETLPGELFLGEVSLYQLRRDIRSDLRAGFLHADLLPFLEEGAKHLWYPHTCVCSVSMFYRSSNQEEMKGSRKKNMCELCRHQHCPSTHHRVTLWVWTVSFGTELLSPGEVAEPVSIHLATRPWGLQRCSAQSTF